jgi:hypothetical protein
MKLITEPALLYIHGFIFGRETLSRQNSSVDNGLDDRGLSVGFPTATSGLPVYHRVQTNFRVHLAPVQRVSGLFSGE